MTDIDFVGEHYSYNGTDVADWNITTRYVSTAGEGRLDVTYAVFEGLVALMAVVGNAMVIVVFKRERRLRRRTNFYIVSLATADFLVGLLGVPFAVLSSVGLPRNLHACLFTISLLIVLCTISIFCLVAVSVDRYWAILHPMAYSRNVRTKTAIGKSSKVTSIGHTRTISRIIFIMRTSQIIKQNAYAAQCFVTE